MTPGQPSLSRKLLRGLGIVLLSLLRKRASENAPVCNAGCLTPGFRKAFPLRAGAIFILIVEAAE